MENKRNSQLSDSDNEDDEMSSPVDIKTLKQKNKMNNRNSVSAEAYGAFNKKADFKPTVVPKSEDQIQKIQTRLLNAFMFSNLTQVELKIVVDAMSIKKANKGDKIITQNEDGEELYVVDEGELDCFKKFGKDEKETYLKTYKQGESFGELALLYNAPRAATIICKSDSSVLFVLDRNTFNNIVKDSAAKKRNKYEAFLKKVEILSTMDDYERLQVADCLKPLTFSKGDTLVKEGETGSAFYIVESGECVATKVLKEGEKAQEVKKYNPGDYFGELALLRDDAKRQANVVAVTDVSICSIDQRSFKRLLGNLEDILKRNMKEYEKFMKQ